MWARTLEPGLLSDSCRVIADILWLKPQLLLEHAAKPVHPARAYRRPLEVSDVRKHRSDVNDRRAVDGFNGANPQPVIHNLASGDAMKPQRIWRWGDRVANTPVSGRRRSERG